MQDLHVWQAHSDSIGISTARLPLMSKLFEWLWHHCAFSVSCLVRQAACGYPRANKQKRCYCNKKRSGWHARHRQHAHFASLLSPSYSHCTRLHGSTPCHWFALPCCVTLKLKLSWLAWLCQQYLAHVMMPVTSWPAQWVQLCLEIVAGLATHLG